MLIQNVSYLMSIHGIKSVKELARRLEMNQPTLHRLLTGEVEDPKYSTLKTIAGYFGRTTSGLMELDLADLDGGNPYIHFADNTPASKYQSFPPEVQAAVINTYCEIVTREAKLFPDLKGITHQPNRLEDLAETLVNGFSKLIES